MKIHDFNARLKDSILIADGAMGSMLHETVGTQRCFDELNSTEPEAVFRVHQAYIEAGAHFIETNTFGANRFKLAPLGLAEEVQRLNSRGLKIAREALRSFSGLPIVAQLTYAEEGTTYGDVRPTNAAAQLKNKNVQVIGANCTLGPQALLPILAELAAVDGLRVSGMPNAGFPKREGDRIVYPRSSPEYFALFAREAAALGVRILGGCCGTTPAHIRAMAEAVKSLRPAKSHPVAHSVETVLRPAPVADREPESRFWKKLQKKEFTVCVEIDPPKGLSLDRIFEQVDRVMASKKVDAIDINSGAMARVGMDALIVAGALEARGIETVDHLTTRDQNIIGLQAALLGAWTVGGVRNV